MKRILAAVVALASQAGAASEPPADPRVLLRVDASLLAPPNVGMTGSGGVELPPGGGTAAGLLSGGGAEFGAEVRLSRWLFADLGAGWYRPTLEVDRVPSVSGATLDGRSASVGFRRAQLALVVAPPRLRSRVGRLAFAALVARGSISGVPPSLGLAVDGGHTGFGADARGEIYLSKDRHWGIGAALVFSDVGPRFTDLESGGRGTLQVSGVLLRGGLRGSW